jgi:hypothetical protein
MGLKWSGQFVERRKTIEVLKIVLVVVDPLYLRSHSIVNSG